MKPNRLLAAWAGLALAAANAASAAPAEPPLVPLLDAATINARCEPELAKARAQLNAMEARKGPAGVFAELNRLSIDFADFANPVYLLQNVAPDKATRDAAQACLEKLVPFETELYQSVPLFIRVKAVESADPIDRVYRQELIEKFEDSGAALPPDKRTRAKAISDEIELMSLQFRKNINEDPTKVVIAPAEAAGLPESWLSARKRDAEGNLVLGLDYPTVVPFLTLATSEEARRKVWLAKQSEGGMPNIGILDRTLKLRHELAQLHGEPDFATWTLKRRMAQTPTAVYGFLGQVKGAVDSIEARDLDDLRAEKATLLGKPAAEVKLNRWDVSFLQERVKKARFNVDQEALRAYFPTDKSVAFTLKLAELLYAVEFAERKIPTWHDDVRYFDVYDREPAGTRGAFVGGVYLDLYPREGKYNHAAAFPVLSVSTLAGRAPVSVLVTNFNRKGLDHDELETLLHEFGHVLHGVLSKTRYADQGGTSVKRDFVEAPSQMFEEWARREEPLALLAQVCPGCPRLTPEQIRQLDAARKFGRGLFYGRQWEFAMYDMKLHTGEPPEALAAWISLEKTMRLGYVEGSLFPAGFGHLMGGYAAGYYGYMWSEVLALDMLSAFDGKLLNPEVGQRYRAIILSNGSQKLPQDLVESFLGRKPTSDAFYAEIVGKR
jgi:thimet oligopeptidase